MNISSKDNVSELEKIALILVDEQIYTMSFFLVMESSMRGAIDVK
jgi:hypothetical protein